MATVAVEGMGVGAGELSSSGGDIGGDLGSVLGAAYDQATGDDTPGGEAGGDSSLPQPGGEDTPGGESAEAQSTQPTEQPQAQADDTGYQLTEDGASYIVPKADLPALRQAQQYQQQMGQLFSSPQEAQMSAQQASDLRAMQNDYMLGSEQAITSILEHWAGMNHQNPMAQAKFQQSFASMAKLMPQVLERVNPQALSAMQDQVISQRIASAYEKAAQSQDPKDFEKAQELDYGVTGQYKTELPKLDPLKAQESAVQRQMREFEQRQSRFVEQQATAFNNDNLEGAKFSRFNKEIDGLLAPIKAKYVNQFGEPAFNAIRAGIQRDAINALKQQSPDWWREHEQDFHGIVQDFKTAQLTGRPVADLKPRVDSYVQQFLSRAKRVLPSVTQRYTNAKTSSSPRQPNGQFAANQQPQARPTSAPPQNGQAKGNQRISSDEWDRQLAAAMAIR